MKDILHSISPLYHSYHNNGRKFQLSEFHFHVGDKDKEQNESEHVLVGHCYKMELHLVHKSQVGRIAVLSVFFKLGV
ncbi:carbonic anhydrase family protein [Bacillus thuringiensis]|uniref:carbonic anhydrase family protein n=1 Tax=Bacillus cereus group TaxID=86661 RepID=UPI00124D7D78|nr:hypothetical protein F8168_14460 [Bacillus cereus]